MSRNSGWGETEQKNSLNLVEALLSHADESLELDDALKTAVQVEWVSANQLRVTGKEKQKTGNRIVDVGTRKEHLVALIKKTGKRLELGKGQGSQQDKELNAIQTVIDRLRDLEVLKEDPNKKKTQGYWKFTLTLQHQTESRDRNLAVVKQKWQKQTASNVPELSPTPTEINWRDICGKVLETQQLRRQATTQQYELNIYVPLGLMERSKTPNPRINPTGEESQPQKEPELQIVQTYKDDAFFQKVIAENRTDKAKHIAIIGEPGAGKTTLLGKLAEHLPKNPPDFPICIRLADLRDITIKDYLVNNWLEKALEHIEPVPQSVTPEIIEAFKQLFRQSKVWLLLDGVDEMAAESPVLALARIREQLTDWVGKARVVLTCRLNVWDATNSNTLTNFETYKTLEFEPDDVDEFIREWFEEASQDEKRRNSGHETFWREQGNSLQQQLKEPGKDNIRRMVRNPLRLSMLCQSWCVPEQDLPETKAELYEQFTTYFFEWKQEEFQKKHQRVLKETDKKQIQQALAKLALAAMETTNRFRIEQEFAIDQMEEEWFDLADELGWLVLVDRDTRTKKPVYAFYHPTFQEYLAACAIEDWHYFLNHIPDNPKDSKASYRIFDNQWKEVILLWLGREDLRTECKESFIKDLVEFQDRCREYILESKGFYEYRAYFLAALGIAEFRECSCADAILSQLIRWGYGDFNLNMQMWVGTRRYISEAARAAFQESDRSRTIPALINVMLNSTTDATNTLLANMVESLGQIGTGNQQAIEALLNVISTTSNLYPLIEGHYLIDKAFNSLGLIGQNNQELIDELNKIMQSSQHEYTCVKAAECLGTIVFGNEQAIARLVDVIEKSAGDFMRSSEAHLSLAKIAPDHPQAGISIEHSLFDVVRQLLEWLIEEKKYNKDELKRRWAAETFNHIASKSPQAVKSLIYLIKNTSDEKLILDAVRLLGAFGLNNQEAILLLIELSYHKNFIISRFAIAYLGAANIIHEQVIQALIDMVENAPDIRSYAASSLGKILNRYPLLSAVKKIKNYMQSQMFAEGDFDFYCKLYDTLWHCVQTMPFPDFYEAWHQDTLTNSATASSYLINLPQFLAKAISDRPDLCNKVKLICIDSDKFGNPENPATKIYNEMRLQGCEKSEDGKPKTMAELQDYWDELRIESQIPLFFICYDSTALSATPTGFSEPFLNALSKFDRAICVVCEPGDIPLQSFSPTQPDLIADIVAWMRQKMIENM